MSFSSLPVARSTSSYSLYLGSSASIWAFCLLYSSFLGSSFSASSKAFLKPSSLGSSFSSSALAFSRSATAFSSCLAFPIFSFTSERALSRLSICCLAASFLARSPEWKYPSTKDFFVCSGRLM